MTINRLFNIAIASLLFSFLAILTPVSKTKDNVTAESALAELTAGNAFPPARSARTTRLPRHARGAAPGRRGVQRHVGLPRD